VKKLFDVLHFCFIYFSVITFHVFIKHLQEATKRSFQELYFTKETNYLGLKTCGSQRWL